MTKKNQWQQIIYCMNCFQLCCKLIEREKKKQLDPAIYCPPTDYRSTNKIIFVLFCAVERLAQQREKKETQKKHTEINSAVFRLLTKCSALIDFQTRALADYCCVKGMFVVKVTRKWKCLRKYCSELSASPPQPTSENFGATLKLLKCIIPNLQQ